MKKFLIASTMIATLGMPVLASAQGMPVYDNANLLKQIESVTNQLQQIEKLKSQIEEAQKLYGSLNKLTDISSLANILNDPAVKNALPQEFSQIQNLLKGQGGGNLSGFADAFKNDNTYYKSDSNSFYNDALGKARDTTAGYAGVGQGIYQAAEKKLQGIQQLKDRIATATDQKEVLDLQARIQAESAGLQTDYLKMQGLQMVQQAQVRAEEQRQKENSQKMVDTFKGNVK